MAYTINKTDGTVLTTLIDGTVDTTTDLTLIGKNFSGFGELLNENLVKLLENFAGTAAPDHPIIGEVWYDTGEGRLKVYSPTGWKAAGGPVVSEAQPLNLTTGDLWINNNENQIWFYDGTDLILIGPTWKKSQGKSGFVTETIVDLNGNARTILNLYVGDFLFGIFTTQAFTPKAGQVTGFTSFIKGFNSNPLVSWVFDAVVSKANALTDSGGNPLTYAQFMRSDVNSTTSGKILIQNNDGLTVGLTQTGDIKVAGTSLFMENVVPDGDIVIKTNNLSGSNYPIYIDSGSNRIGVYTTNPTETMDIEGSLRIRGDLIVEGTNLTLEVSSMKVEDKNIELAVTTSPTDALADGAGITIKATIDKTIAYNNTTKAFDFSEHLNIAAGKAFRIGNVDVLTANSLSAAVTSAPGITSFGPQVSITVDELYLNDNRISTTASNLDIELDPSGTGNVALIGSPRITGLADPVSNQDASTKIHSETFAKQQPLSLTMISNGLTASINTNAILLLNDVAPAVLYTNGKFAYIHVQEINFSLQTITRSLKKFEIQSGAWTFVSDLSSSI
jgi:hypothetical protein